jgi:enterochelin esterase-like enzyme
MHAYARLTSLALGAAVLLLPAARDRPGLDAGSESGDVPPSGAAAEPVIEDLTIAAPSLDGNLLGDRSEVKVSVQTPASYASDPSRHYPVVYFLAGFDEAADVAPIGRELEQLVNIGQAPEMILVAVSGENALGGSFYVDSPVSGGWASAVVNDVVSGIDTRYRTLATPASRGIAGFSMGGYGALTLAFAHPDVFGAVYALSPGLFAPGGLAQSQMFSDPAVIADFVAGQAELAAMSAVDAPAQVMRSMGRSADTRFSTAYGVAFAPDPDGPPPWIRYPFSDPTGPPDPAAWALWENGFGGPALVAAENRDSLLALRGIVIDVGVYDEYTWIPPGCEYLHEQLDLAGVPNRLETFQGGHGPVGPRARAVMFPFFTEALDHQ